MIARARELTNGTDKLSIALAPGNITKMTAVGIVLEVKQHCDSVILKTSKINRLQVFVGSDTIVIKR